jgi:lauroyl/myristoyl acyltransferase
MLRRERVLGRLATLAPNRKFAATGLLAMEADLVSVEDKPAFVRANAAFVWSYYLRFARLASRRGRKRTYDKVTSLGEERLHAAASQGKGMILLSVHLGDFDAGGGWLAERQGITPVVIAQPLKPRWRDALFSLVRRRCGVLLRETDSTSLDELKRDLQRRRAVLVMLDRRPPGPTSPSRMLGQPAVAPLAVGSLAARSQAPLLPAATWRGSDGALIAWFGEPFTATEPAQAMARISEAAEQLGDLIRAHPEQWHVPADVKEMSWAPPEALRHGADAKVAPPLKGLGGRPSLSSATASSVRTR